MSPLIHFFPLEKHFFGEITKENFLDEIELSLEHLKYTYSELMKLPTYIRRYELGKLIKKSRDLEDEEDSKDKAKSFNAVRNHN